MTPVRATVQVEQLPECGALKIVWQMPADRADAERASQALKDALDQTRQPLYVLVELRGDTRIPAGIVVSEALRASCASPMLTEMLVYGALPSARVIGRRLTLLTGQSNVRGFETECEARRYLRERMAG